MAHSGSMLEDNLDRVIDSVVRNITAGRGAVSDSDAVAAGVAVPDAQAAGAGEPNAGQNEDEARNTLADLYGHVAYALKSLDAPHSALATYKAPEALPATPTLNLVR